MKNYELVSLLRYLKLDFEGTMSFRDLKHNGFVGNGFDYELVRMRNELWKDLGKMRAQFVSNWK